jgi:hypothetical protein
MTTAVAPSLSISPRVQLTARQRACLEQIARRQTSPQRLVRRAKILLALETGATQCHVMRQLHLNRGTVQVWGRRWCALASKLEHMEADGSSDKVLTTVIVEALTDHADLQPHRVEYWLNAKPDDPVAFTAQVAAVCEAYQQAPAVAQAGGHVISTDEKTGIQALERAAPTLPMKPGLVERPEYA